MGVARAPDELVVREGRRPSAHQARIGIVGCGRVFECGYLHAVRRCKSVVLAAVADLDVERCQRLAPGVPAFDSAESLLSDSEVDAVVVATPPAAHLAPARTAARAGVPTLVEKPPASSVVDARELAELDPPPWIGFNRRFLSGLRERRAVIRERATALELELHYRHSEWRPYTPAPDALLDTAPHLVDLAQWLTAVEVQRVRAFALTPRSGDVELDLGRLGARLVWSVDRAHRERIEAHDGGARLFRHLDGGPWRAVGRRVRRPSEDNPFVNSLARQLDALASQIRGVPQETLATAADGLSVMRVLDSLRSSAVRQGAWEEVAT